MITRVSDSRNEPGRPGGHPPGLPQIRTCPIKASGSSRRGLACPLLPVAVPWTAYRGPMPPRCCPTTAPRRGAPFPPPGPRGTSSPASAVLWGAPIPGRPSRPTSFPSRDGYCPARLCSSLRPSPTPACGQGCSGQATPLRPVVIEAETVGRPKFLGNPPVPMPCSLTPAGADAAGRYTAPPWPPHAARRRLATRGNFGAQSHGLGTRCLRFARRIARGGRKTRFWLLTKLYQAGFGPAGFRRKVSVMSVHHFPLSQASWRRLRPLLPAREPDLHRPSPPAPAVCRGTGRLAELGPPLSASSSSPRA
jgi:hypothetical protein